MNSRTTSFYFFLLVALFPLAQLQGLGDQCVRIAGTLSATSIKVTLSNFEHGQLWVARYEAGKFNYIDTLKRTGDEPFLLQRAEPLDYGTIVFVLPPNRKAVQIFIDEDQEFEVFIDAKNIHPSTIKIKHHSINEKCYEYLRWISDKRRTQNKLHALKDTIEGDRLKMTLEEIENINQAIFQHQKKILKKHQNDWLSRLVQIDFEPVMPSFEEASPKEIQEKEYLFRKQHFFHGIDWQDTLHAFNPRLYSRLKIYYERMVVQERDSLTNEWFAMIDPLEAQNPLLFKALVDYATAFYDPPRFVGQDAIYVDLVEHYHRANRTPWLTEKRQKEIISHANKLDRLLLGKSAPPLIVQNRSGDKIDLHEIDADFTILFFWRPGCGHCKKSTAPLKEFYAEYKDRGIEVLRVCTHVGKTVPECWSYVDEHELHDWIEAVDPYHQSKFLHVYMASRTPKLYVLNRDKEIVLKNIDVQQLDRVLDKLLKDMELEDSLPKEE